MTKFLLAAGVAALAIASPTLAGPKGGHGNGGDHGQNAERGNQGGGKHGGNGGGFQQARGGDFKQARGGGDHGGGRMMFASYQDHGKGHGGGDKGRGGGQGNGKHWDAKPMKVQQEARQGGREWRNDRRDDRRVDVRNVVRVENRVNDGRWNDGYYSTRGSGRVALIDGCPPGLAKKGNGCLPPGQAKKIVGYALPAAYASRMLDGPYRDWYRDDDRYQYRMGDGYLYQVNRQTNLVDALIPYGMGDYAYYPVGYNYPDEYNYYNVPTQYRSYYPDGGDYDYRYGGNAIYSINPQTNLVQSIVSLLAGDLSVGQQLPSSYGVYNVPLAYRDQYYDTPNDMYRYNDGYIYRVDPSTQLITAVINALV